MILVHLSINGKLAIINSEQIIFAEECEGKNEKNELISFTRIYLKQALPGENGSSIIDVNESVETLLKYLAIE